MSEQRYVLVPPLRHSDFDYEVVGENKYRLRSPMVRAAVAKGFGHWTAEECWSAMLSARPPHLDDLLKAMEEVCDEVGKTMSIETPKSVQEAYAHLSAARDKVASSNPRSE